MNESVFLGIWIISGSLTWLAVIEFGYEGEINCFGLIMLPICAFAGLIFPIGLLIVIAIVLSMNCDYSFKIPKIFRKLTRA